ncbi:MAG TPA: hypothetical protein PLN52_17395 [Opitutaceae bacterium]|nr:hypothetical protein [Opitutaceae bacterium]
MGTTVLALFALHGNDVFASGSAVLVAPHLALTARHVTDDFAERYLGFASQADGSVSYAILARCFSQGAWRMFHVLQTFNTAATDITALYISPAPNEPDDFVWPSTTLDLLPPIRGSGLVSWGHITPHANFADIENGVIHWRADFVSSTGLVQDIFPSGVTTYLLIIQHSISTHGSMPV